MEKKRLEELVNIVFWMAVLGLVLVALVTWLFN